MTYVTARPLSQRIACNLAGERCAPGQCIWVSTKLKSTSHQYAAARVYDAYHNGEFDIMAHFIQMLYHLAQEHQDGAWQLTAQTMRGTLQLARGETEAARATFEHAANLANQPSASHRFLAQLQEAVYGWALAAYDLENLPEFEQMVDHFNGLVGSCGCPCVDDIRTLVLSGLDHIALGRFTLATSCFQQLISRFQQVSPFYRFVATFGIAECALRNGDTSSAQAQLELLNQSVEHGTGRGAIMAWLRRFPYTYALVQRMFSHWQIISEDEMGLMKLPLSRRADAMLRIHALGNGEVYLNGRLCDFSSARPSLVLLTYLALYPEGVRVEYIMQTLWPQAQNDQSFMTALRGVRRLLGEQAILCKNSVYSINPQLRTWIDVTAFVETYTRALKLGRDAKEDALISCAALYKGPFLQMASQTWVDDMRYKLMLKMANAWWHIAACAAERGDLDSSIEYLQKALEIDPLYEKGVAGLMRQFDQSGQRASAMRVYQIHARRMGKTFGSKPSPHLQDLARRIQEDDRLLTGAFDVQELSQALQRSTPPLLMAVRPEPVESDKTSEEGDTAAWIN